MVDLWNNNFYGKVKDKLLGTNIQVNLLEELQKLYNEKTIETELYQMIEQIEKNN